LAGILASVPHSVALGDCDARRCGGVRFYCPARTDERSAV
jgi:hypothetical protein